MAAFHLPLLHFLRPVFPAGRRSVGFDRREQARGGGDDANALEEAAARKPGGSGRIIIIKHGRLSLPHRRQPESVHDGQPTPALRARAE